MAGRERRLREATIRNQALVELARARDERAAVTVHDLKNPLSVIFSSCDYILEGFEGSADCRGALEDCRAAAESMLQLLANLADPGCHEGGALDRWASEPELVVPPG
jgi:signal transduction histidine kinase